MLTFRDLVTGLRKIGLDPTKPVIAHASLSAFGRIQGGAEAMLGAILATSNSLIMPAFTYRTMIIPEVGPPDNGIDYGRSYASNRSAQIFDPDMPVDPLMGVLSEALRCHPKARRSLHPILSFTGINAESTLEAQSYAEPLAPIRVVAEGEGWVLLLGVNHTVNTSIHYAERLAGRKQFVRWALTQHGARECPGFPGCSEGFQALVPKLEGFSRKAQIGTGQVEAIPLPELIETARAWIHADPTALLCSRSYCKRCSATRNEALKNSSSGPD
jgi:aminoglycoside 3-N-acetyltransferase